MQLYMMCFSRIIYYHILSYLFSFQSPTHAYGHKDRKSTESNEGRRFTPRATLIDLEPGDQVIVRRSLPE